MIFGNKNIFAIESQITEVDTRLSIRGIGYFLLHIQNVSYGVCQSDATALACSFDEVGNRIIKRNMHVASFSGEKEPELIATTIWKAIYGEEQGYNNFFGLTNDQFVGTIYSNNILWAPDGDEAFDDGSFVVQFDVGSQVSLIGFKSVIGDKICSNTLTDLWMCKNEFYQILQCWYDAFLEEWLELTKN